jgi:DNA polymerase III subunit gamma/tau
MDEKTGTPFPDEPALPGFAPAPPAAAPSPYRVLARKYRPRTFDDLIGQDAMVRTVSNAFETGRIPQAWMLTGVRGVGKTTTARILARGLNYQLSGENGLPTVRMPALGVHCEAIIEGRHIDVQEIDAASNNGVDNIRQISDAVRYTPVSARYKVYIVDEVHMLSTAAFNAFLKTLEEPPPHAKFVFATTEIRKVPVTILSRCQRFDLRRIASDVLVSHLARICVLEEVEAEPEALALIARAADGSVRDGLSLLDQAIAHGAGRVEAATVRDMLGLADRVGIVDLWEAAMRGDLRGSFASVRALHEVGADPAVVIADLAAFTHLVTRLKLVPEAAGDPALTEVERVRGTAFAKTLSIRTLSRAWQILLMGKGEVEGAPRPLAAAEMVLVRLAFAADLPTPDEALRALKGGPPVSTDSAPQASSPVTNLARESGPQVGAPQISLRPASAGPAHDAARPSTETARSEPQDTGPTLRRFEDVVALCGERREIGLKIALERDARLVRFEPGRIELNLADGDGRRILADLGRLLHECTGRRWVVAPSPQAGAPTLHEQRENAARERTDDAVGHPLVRAVLQRFPGAQIVDVRENRAEPSDGETELVGERHAADGPERDEDP